MAALSSFSPSGVLALMPTQLSGKASISATRVRISAVCGAIFGAARIRLASTLATAYPAARTRASASRKKIPESAPFHRGLDGGNNAPMSGAAIAPSSASVMACNSTSPSEWPPRPWSWASATPPILRGIPGRNSCESNPYPMRVVGLRSLVVGILGVYRALASSLMQIELGQFHVAGIRNLDVPGRSHHDGDIMSRAFDQRSLVGSRKSVGGGFVEGFLDHKVAKALRRLRQNDRRPWNRRLDDRSFGGAFHLLHRVDRGQSRDRGSVFLGRPNDVVNDLAADQGAHCVMHQNYVIGSGGNGVQCVLD